MINKIQKKLYFLSFSIFINGYTPNKYPKFGVSKYPMEPPSWKTGNINNPRIMYIENALKTTFFWNISVSKIIVGICHVIGISKLLIGLSINGSGI